MVKVWEAVPEVKAPNKAEVALDKICQLHERKTVNPFFSFLYNTSDVIKWRTNTAMAKLVPGFTEQDMESASFLI